jgi:hypothetical protein
MQFQRSARIKVDGIIGPQTRGALARHMAARDHSRVDKSFRIEGARRAPAYAGGRTAKPAPKGMIAAGQLQYRDAQRRAQNLTGTQNRGSFTRDPNQAFTGAPNQALTGAPNQAFTGAPNQAFTGGPNQAFTGGPNQAFNGTQNPVVNGPQNQSFSGNSKYDFYANIVRSHGGTISPNQATVLGVRMRDGPTKQFEDRIVVLSPNGNVSEFSASTRSSSGPTELVPGNYRVWARKNDDGSAAYHNGAPTYQVLNQNGRDGVPVYRDYRQSRVYNNGTGILFHPPKPYVHDTQPTSIGCINLHRADWGRFMAALGGHRDFSFTLINR